MEDQQGLFETRTREQVSDEVERLAGLWEAGNKGDLALRRTIGLRLAALRSVYKDEPDLFDPRSLSLLKSISAGLKGPIARSSDRHDKTPEDLLKGAFGYEAFRPGQKEIIETVLSGRDCIGVMPTGAGKSLTYQLPARVLGGTTLVVSPLIALMKDQVDALLENGFRATFLNSSLTPEEKRDRVERLRNGEYELVYAAPEGLEASVGAALSRIGDRLSLIAVDEAHCISQWGHDFRPAYRNLQGLKSRFGGIPVLALTATATHEVVRDIVSQLGMIEPGEFRGSFFRSNLFVSAYRKGGDGSVNLRDSILRLVRARTGQAGIVYCLSRKTVEQMSEFLADHGVKSLPYHAGMDSEERTRVQDSFKKDDTDVICATVAFGMGIDKSNIRYVIHRDMPRSMESYYQEIGRAGRDGVKSDCVLFYSWADVVQYDRFADDADHRGRSTVGRRKPAGTHRRRPVERLSTPP